MTQLYRKKKIEIVVEAARARAIIEMIEAVGAKGYTIVPDVSGRGNRGVRDEAHLSDVFRNMLIIVIAAEEIANRIIEQLQPLLKDYAGIVVISDVEVIRDEHF
ncbi:MAG: DUF190 domain-containing protein [Alphaproteobacteria bacterium]|jgi:nitrogen regulatory protein PII|nr:DUF190 domain-containing protein [Alphaproteobacteria bacterium]